MQDQINEPTETLQDINPESDGTEALSFEQPEEAESKPAPPSKTYRIGSKKFDSEEEAQAYAEQLEREKISLDAYNQGLLAAQEAQRNVNTQTQPTTEPEPEDDFDDRFYANPKQYLKERDETVYKRAVNDIKSDLAKEKETETIRQRFYSNNDDLTDYQDLVQVVYAQNRDLLESMRDVDKAMDLLAEKTRARIQKIRDAGKPQEELNVTRAGASQGNRSIVSGGPAQTSPQKPVGFAEQVRRMSEKHYRRADS